MTGQPLPPSEEPMPHVSAQAAEPEFYEEPARMTGADAASVIFALLALLIIGAAGYIWINPDLGWQDIRARFVHQAAPAQPAAAPVAPAASDATAAPEANDSSAAAVDRSATACAQCGMFTDQTLGLIIATWNDDTTTRHDCWTCLTKYEKENGLKLSSAKALDYDKGLEARRELDAAGASYLYGVSDLPGSMKPYVAAFADSASAKAAQASLGGELLDFAGLRARLDKEVSGE